MLERLREIVRTARTSADLNRGVKAWREGRVDEARAALDAVLAATHQATNVTTRTHGRSVRLLAVTLRAEVAARQGDEAAAAASIREGFAIWEEAHRNAPEPAGFGSVAQFEGWERWAREWLAAHPGV